jgi:ATPases of the AAA+ class
MLYPDKEARLEILRVHTSVVRKVPLAKDVDLSVLADATELWSGAELEELVKRACRKALNDGSDVVSMDHFLEALKTFRINMNERKEQMERYLRLAMEFCNDAQFLENLMKQYKDVSRLEAIKRF